MIAAGATRSVLEIKIIKKLLRFLVIVSRENKHRRFSLDRLSRIIGIKLGLDGAVIPPVVNSLIVRLLAVLAATAFWQTVPLDLFFGQRPPAIAAMRMGHSDLPYFSLRFGGHWPGPSCRCLMGPHDALNLMPNKNAGGALIFFPLIPGGPPYSGFPAKLRNRKARCVGARFHVKDKGSHLFHMSKYIHFSPTYKTFYS